jgi:hypothetical protein
MGMDQMWSEWFMAFRAGLGESDRPVGWYTLTDLRAAFDAGAVADHERGLREIIGKIRAAVQEVEQ